MSRCLDCQKLTSHSVTLRQHGYGNCKAGTEWQYLSVTRERDCAQFAQVTADVAQTRSDLWIKVGAP